jgi:hypothetical protein
VKGRESDLDVAEGGQLDAAWKTVPSDADRLKLPYRELYYSTKAINSFLLLVGSKKLEYISKRPEYPGESVSRHGLPTMQVNSHRYEEKNHGANAKITNCTDRR